jgi:hypothetical protein
MMVLAKAAAAYGSSGRSNKPRIFRPTIAHRARWEHSRFSACSWDMADPFHKAEAWRSRAGQLRDLAARTRDPVASISLAGMAEAVEQHARKLEEMALKMRCTRRARFIRTITRPVAVAAGG